MLLSPVFFIIPCVGELSMSQKHLSQGSARIAASSLYVRVTYLVVKSPIVFQRSKPSSRNGYSRGTEMVPFALKVSGSIWSLKF